ncbi:MAG TPA: DUF692 domain-containing protein [bacterium]|nr:DUF692 domain-containing protein [bacterium]
MASKITGAGLGLRSRHLARILETSPEVPWFEILADNYLQPGEIPHRALEKVRSRYPAVFHGVGMNLGSTDPLNLSYFKRLSELIDRYEPEWVSDHLCWIGAQGLQSHDLLPLPFTREAVDHAAGRIRQVQDFLKRRVLVENLSGYLEFAEGQMPEWEFVKAVAEAADCDLLLDVNNVYVNSENLRFDPLQYLDALPVARVKQMHLAGHLRADGLLIDNHGAPVAEEVWDLYRHAVTRFKGVPTLIEWDLNIPDFDVLYAESRKAQAIWEAKSHVA